MSDLTVTNAWICLICACAIYSHHDIAHAQGQTGAISTEGLRADPARPPVGIGDKNGSPLTTSRTLADPYAGIVVNQTITVAGHDFFQYFIAAWRDKDMVDKYAIAVTERPSPRLGTQIWISYRERRVFQTFLPASRAAIRPLSLLAAENVHEAIVQTDLQQLLFKDPDLAPDEF